MRRLFIVSFSVFLVFGSVMHACVSTDLQPLNPCTVSGVNLSVSVDPVNKIDLLFVIDNSGSMTEEQSRLSNEIAGMLNVLVNGDLDGDNIEDFKPVNDIHAGVVTTDMGDPTNRGNVDCGTMANHGDDGRIGYVKTTRNVNDSTPRSPRFAVLSDGASAAERATFISQVEALADVGTVGCGVERQLEAMAKATSASDNVLFPGLYQGGGDTDVPTNLSADVGGQADASNADFFREDALLAIILVTDEEDCSLTNPLSHPFVNPGEVNGMNRLNVLCQDCLQGAAGCSVEPVRALAEAMVGPNGFKTPQLFVFGAIIGLPTDPGAPPRYGSDDFDSWLSDSDFSYGEISDSEYVSVWKADVTPNPNLVVAEPVCNLIPEGSATATTIATPGIRIVEMAKALSDQGANASVHSICADSFRPAIQDIVTRIADTLNATCLPRALNLDSGGLVNCDVLVRMPDGVDCTGRPGLDPEPLEEPSDSNGNRYVCQAIQRAVTGGTAPTEPGWYYNESPGENCPASRPQQIAFTDIDDSDDVKATPKGSVLSLDCKQPVQGANGEVTIGTPCDSDSLCEGASVALAGDPDASPFPYQLQCDEMSRTCVPVCDFGKQNADCAGGFVCVTPTEHQAMFMLPNHPISGSNAGICVNPTCN